MRKLFFFFAFMVSLSCWSYDVEIDGIWYNFLGEDEVEVTCYQSANQVSSYSGSVIIPKAITYNKKTYQVTRIGNLTFYGCSNLRFVTIPKGVTSIGNGAFSGCSGLTSITIPEGVTSIECSAFEECSSLTSVTIPKGVTSVESSVFEDCSNLTSVTIPKGVTSIGASAFEGCSGLTSVTIPNGVTTIGESAFSGCSALTSVTIPKGVTSIGYYAFSGCSALTSVTIPEGVTTIEYSVFEGCLCLMSVTIPEGVTTIGSSAFRDCSSLTSVRIPKEVISIGNYAFSGCSGLTSVTINSNTLLSKVNYFNTQSILKGIFGDQVKEYIIGDDVTTIADYAFRDCSSLTSITIPEGVTSIGALAFSGCSGLTSVTIPESVTTIDNSAFEDCSSLTSVTIPKGVTSIGGYAFSGCSNLTSVTISEGVTSIGGGAFSGCSGLTSVTLPESVTTIESSAFEDCSGLTSVIIPKGMVSIGYYVFSGCSGLTSVTINSNTLLSNVHIVKEIFGNQVKEYIIGDDVTAIADYAFKGCSGLTSVTIPNSVTTIGNQAFSGCSGLTSVTIPNSVTTIGSQAFSGCSGLTSVTIPESVTTIVYLAFENCSGLTSVTIPNSVTTIGDQAFSGCSGLTSITIPNSVTSIGNHAFWDCLALTSVEINSNTILSKQYYIGIMDIFGDQVKEYIIGNDVTSIRSNAFRDCSNLTSVTISESVTSIGASPFGGCIALKTISVKKGNKIYDSRDNCNAIIESSTNTLIQGCANTSIPNSVTSIGNFAFYDCSGLKSVTIPEGVTSIDSYAFSGCSGLTSVVINSNALLSNERNKMKSLFGEQVKEYIIGNDVTRIGSNAFRDCSNLTSVTISEGVTSIYGGAFSGCSGLTSVTIPESVTTIKTSAFDDCTALKTLSVEKGNKIYDSRDNCNAIIESATNTLIQGCANTSIPKSVTKIGDHAFSGCSNLTSITIPSSVTTIGDDAFKASGIISVTIPGNVETIGDFAFEDCLNLVAVKISEGVSVIGNYAFGGCRSLTSIVIPKSVKTIFINPFIRCENLTAIKVEEGNKDYDSRDNCNAIIKTRNNILLAGCKSTVIPESITNIEVQAFEGCGISSLVIPDNIIGIGGSAFDYCSALSSIILPAGINYIGGFANCTSLVEVDIPDGVTTIDPHAFAGCSSLSAVTFGEKISKIGENAFYGCKSLTDINLSNSVTQIGSCAFGRCSGLTSFTIPGTVSFIGEMAFEDCESLEKIAIKRSSPFDINPNVFPEIVYERATLYVPIGSSSSYRQGNGWNKFVHIEEIEMPDAVTVNSPFENLKENQMIMAYQKSSRIENGSFGGSKGHYKACIGFDKAKIKPYVGNRITHVRFALADANISSAKIWIGSSRYKDAQYLQDVSDLKIGWNEVELTQSFEIQDDSLFIGVEYTQDKEQYPLTFTDSDFSEEGFFYFYGPYDERRESQWRAVGKRDGYKLNLQCLIEGASVPQYDIHLSYIRATLGYAQTYFKPDDEYSITIDFSNFGKKQIEYYDIAYMIDGSEVESVRLCPTGLDYWQKKLWAKFKGLSVGVHKLSFFIKSINGEVPLYTSDDTLSIDFKVYKNMMERKKVYVEINTGTWCPNVLKLLPEYEKLSKSHTDVTMVCVHSSDQLSCDAGDVYSALYPIVPTHSVDHYVRKGDWDLTSVSGPGGSLRQDVELFKRLPALASVNIIASYISETRTLLIKVKGECVDDFFSLEKEAQLTVLLTENDVIAPQYDGINMRYIYNYSHQDVLRTNVSAVWGDPITWNGNQYEKNYSIVLDEEWEKDNMKIVAYLAKPFNGKDFDDIYVVNCNDFAVADATTVGINDIQDNDTKSFEVYSINGMRVKQQATNLSGLPRGIYIVKGKKMLVK